MDIKTYVPEKRVDMGKEKAVPILMDLGDRFFSIGSLFGFFLSSFLLSLKTFRKTKKKVREFSSRYERTLDLS